MNLYTVITETAVWRVRADNATHLEAECARLGIESIGTAEDRA